MQLLAEIKGLSPDAWKARVRQLEARIEAHDKAAAKLRKHYGGPVIGGESMFDNLDGPSAGMDGIADAEAGPELKAMLNEASEELFRCLDDDKLKSIAIHKMENYSNKKKLEVGYLEE